MHTLAIPQVILELLEESKISYQIIELPQAMDIQDAADFLKDDRQYLLRSVAIRSQSKTMLAVLPYEYLLDVRNLSLQTESDVDILSQEDSAKLFNAGKGISRPVFPGTCRADITLDPSIFDLDNVIMESGDPSILLKFNREAIDLLFKDCQRTEFAVNTESVFAGRNSTEDTSVPDSTFTPIRLKQRVDETFDLPAMPEIAQDIMKLRVDPGADATRLAQIVLRDPSLAAQVISWASSPYYGYQGKVDSVETAIARVLGFELVMNLALGISIGKSLHVPMEGPIGVREFWKQAIYTASLSEKLCKAMPVKQRPERGLIYLSGLLHNFGHLLLGHIFPPQFKLVNATIEANPYTSVDDIEFYVLGVTHEEIGAWLMQNWHMPDELVVAVHRHHQEEFWSKHAVYSNVVLVANRMLKRLDIGDAVDKDLPESTLELLSLDPQLVEDAFEALRLESESLDIMAKQLVA